MPDTPYSVMFPLHVCYILRLGYHDAQIPTNQYLLHSAGVFAPRLAFYSN